MIGGCHQVMCGFFPCGGAGDRTRWVTQSRLLLGRCRIPSPATGGEPSDSSQCYHAHVLERLEDCYRLLRFLAAKRRLQNKAWRGNMLVPNNGNWGRSNSSPGGWALAGAVVVLMASLVFLTNGRSGQAMRHGHMRHASVHFQHK
jgi:hypothetical protein